MRRQALAFTLGAIVAVGCAAEPETESMTGRTIELADSVDALLATLGGHMSAVMAADDMRDVRALEREQWETSEALLDRVGYWIAQLEDCVGEDREPPDTAPLYALLADAETTAVAHILVALLSDELEAVIHNAEIGYQIDMVDQMGELRAHPIYGEDVSETYSCPVLFDYRSPAPDVAVTGAYPTPGRYDGVVAPDVVIPTTPPRPDAAVRVTSKVTEPALR